MGLIGRLHKGRATGGPPLPDDPRTEKDCPWLWQFLTVRGDGNGRARIAADLTIEAGFGTWLATLRCHSEALQFTVPIPALAGLADALEAVLTSGNVPWRDYESWKTKPRKEEHRKKS